MAQKKTGETKSLSEPRVVVMYCQNAVTPEVALVDSTRDLGGVHARFIVMPCASKIEIVHLVKLLENGVDGIVVVSCPPAACKFLGGARMGHKRVEYVRARLAEMGVDQERVSVTVGGGLSEKDLVELARAKGESIAAQKS